MMAALWQLGDTKIKPHGKNSLYAAQVKDKNSAQRAINQYLKALQRVLLIHLSTKYYPHSKPSASNALTFSSSSRRFVRRASRSF